MKQVIVIATHRSGIPFLEVLLESLKGFDKYPILLVISEYKPQDKPIFEAVVQKFPRLPIKLETIASNSFEFGALYTAYRKTDYDEFFLLSHSCEIKDARLFDILFTEHKGKSVALSLLGVDWVKEWWDIDPGKRRVLSFFTPEALHEKRLEAEPIFFFQGHIAKYRREILKQIKLEEYLPHNIIEAITKSELLFTPLYHKLDPGTVVLFDEWNDFNCEFEFKYGRRRMKIANEYIVKWKSHWMLYMIADAFIMPRPHYRLLVTLINWNSIAVRRTKDWLYLRFMDLRGLFKGAGNKGTK